MKSTETDLVEYYQYVYKGKIRDVDEKWLEEERQKYEGCQGYMEDLARDRSKRLFNSYKPDKSLDSKRTYVLWKVDSICALLQKYRYFACNCKHCERCYVNINANQQLKEINLGIDNPHPMNTKIEKPRAKDRKIYHYKNIRGEVSRY